MRGFLGCEFVTDGNGRQALPNSILMFEFSLRLINIFLLLINPWLIRILRNPWEPWACLRTPRRLPSVKKQGSDKAGCPIPIIDKQHDTLDHGHQTMHVPDQTWSNSTKQQLRTDNPSGHLQYDWKHARIFSIHSVALALSRLELV